MRPYILLIIFLSSLLSINAGHPIHLSVINMEIDDDTGKLEYSVRLFQEDLSTLLSVLYHEALHKNQQLDSNAISEYITQNFTISDKNKKYQPILIKEEGNDLEYWLYYEIQLNEFPKELVIENKILVNIYADQKNLVIFSYKNKEKGLTFDLQTRKQPIILENILSGT